MLFPSEDWPRLADGSLTETYRRWRRPQVVAGRRYRTPVGFIVVDAVDQLQEAELPDGVAVGGDPELPITRVRFHRVDDPDPRAALAADTEVDVDALTTRLDRMDARSSHGPWTRQTLRLIAQHPERRAGDLAELLGRDRDDWKRDVRKLKQLGLTLSLEVGYRLSPRGAAYLAALDREGTGPQLPGHGGPTSS